MNASADSSAATMAVRRSALMLAHPGPPQLPFPQAVPTLTPDRLAVAERGSAAPDGTCLGGDGTSAGTGVFSERRSVGGVTMELLACVCSVAQPAQRRCGSCPSTSSTSRNVEEHSDDKHLFETEEATR